MASARNEEIPLGWVVDRHGHPTHDPNALGEGGALLPFGADQMHKGYGLSFMVEALSGVLTGIGYSHDPAGFSNDGAFVAVFAVDRFLPLDEFRKEMRGFIEYLKESPLAAGHEEILYPGEPESRAEARRRRDGIVIEDETWGQLMALSHRLGVEAP